MSDKSLLAKLLATENITIQRNPSLKTAMFDLKNRVLMLPDRKSTRLNSSHSQQSRMPSSA